MSSEVFLRYIYYYIPISKVDGWDGFVLWLKIVEEEVKKNYERDTIPDPSRFYVKDFPGYTSVYPEVTMITPRFIRPVYTAKDSTPEELAYTDVTFVLAHMIRHELSNHVASTH